MTSKSFKGLLSANELNVVGYGDSSQVDLLIRRSDRAITSTGIAIAPSDVPALALAILEAAGWPNEYLVTTEILRRLREFDEHLKAIETEAKDKAELEAEALELFNVKHGTDLDDWKYADRSVVSGWVSVARKAREMRAEK